MENLKNSLGILQRYKNTVPFSQILNDYIEKKFEALVASNKYEIFFVENEPYFINNRTSDQAFEAMKEDSNKGILLIWCGASEGTIFGEASINWKFRAIHDSYHLELNLGFDSASELMVNYHQLQKASFDGLPEFERELLNIETAGQVLYFVQNGNFPADQRKFCISELYKTYNYQIKERKPEYFNESINTWNL